MLLECKAYGVDDNLFRYLLLTQFRLCLEFVSDSRAASNVFEDLKTTFNCVLYTKRTSIELLYRII